MKFVSHSRRVLRIALAAGWRAAARYTNLRDARGLADIAFLDIDWKRYDFLAHLEAAARVQPALTVARDVERLEDLDTILREAESLSRYCERVVIVPKDKRMEGRLDQLVPESFLIGFSVPTRYGGTPIRPETIDRPVHLLGGRPDAQRRLAEVLKVVSLDCNRFTFDAAYGDYFDGEIFRPHPRGGYEACIEDSLANINRLWEDYEPEA